MRITLGLAILTLGAWGSLAILAGRHGFHLWPSIPWLAATTRCCRAVGQPDRRVHPVAPGAHVAAPPGAAPHAATAVARSPSAAAAARPAERPGAIGARRPGAGSGGPGLPAWPRPARPGAGGRCTCLVVRPLRLPRAGRTMRRKSAMTTCEDTVRAGQNLTNTILDCIMESIHWDISTSLFVGSGI